jgi:hypothetical protein
MSQNHVIQRTIVELQLPAEDKAHDRQSAISRLFQAALPRAMDAVFSAVAPPDSVLTFDTLVVDLGDIKEGDFSEQLFEKRYLVALEQALKAATREQLTAQSAENVFTSPEVRGFEAFIYFIKNGRLPWSFKVDSEEHWLFQVLTAVEKSPKNAAILRGLFLTNSTRLIQQFPLTFLWVLINKFFPEWGKSGLKHIEEQANDTAPKAFWKDFLQTLLQLVAHKDAATIEALLQIITTDLRQQNITIFMKQVLIIRHLAVAKSAINIGIKKEGPLSINTKNEEIGVGMKKNKEAIDVSLEEIKVAAKLKEADKERPLSIEPANEAIDVGIKKNKETGNASLEEIKVAAKLKEADKKGPLSINTENAATDDGVGVEPIYLNQAGLVILFPFIESFFKTVQVIEDKRFTDETARAKAVHLLHYLATGKTGAGEYDLILEKLLCGVPLGMPIERDVILSENDLKLANDLLGVVINYWTALGTCSVDGLRETFLQRPAKLTVSADDNWLLQVERRTVDILMDRLPWGVSMVKTTWMSRFMVVEW